MMVECKGDVSSASVVSMEMVSGDGVECKGDVSYSVLRYYAVSMAQYMW